jgi:hypothetical protein
MRIVAIAALMLILAAAMVAWFWGNFEVLQDPTNLLAIFTASFICAVTYGAVVLFLFNRFVKRDTVQTQIVALALFLYWFPCLFVGIKIAAMIPLDWGHTNDVFLIPYYGASFALYISATVMYSLRKTSNRTVESDARRDDAPGSP